MRAHHLDDHENHEAEEREEYRRIWREQPDTEEEFGWMTRPAALKHLNEVPWEPDVAPCSA
jgi:hypothetical protein